MNFSIAPIREVAELLLILLLFSLILPVGAANLSGDLYLPAEDSAPGFKITLPPFSGIPSRQPDLQVAAGTSPETLVPVTTRTRVASQTDIASMPFSFIPNTGQIADRNISFTVRGSGSTLYFTRSEVILDNVKNPGVNGPPGFIRQSFPGANRDPVISGVNELPGKVNYFIGRDPSGWQSNIPTYGAVIYRDLYPGIDLLYYGNEGHLKREFRIVTGADPGSIAFRYNGISGISVDGDGSLNITTVHGAFRESPPVSYQDIGGQRVNVSVRYAVTSPESARLVTGLYNPAYPLIIDPKLDYSTFYGGTSNDGGLRTSLRGEIEQRDSVTVDTNGNAYVTGYTQSHDFRVTSGVYQTTAGGLGNATDQDAFVLKLNPAGSSPVWATYLGGLGDDAGDAIAVDASGNVVVTGFTESTNFPTTAGAFNTGPPVSFDAFVTKLNSDGSALIFSTYFGGNDVDQAMGVAMDSAMNVYITGGTASDNFPTTPGVVNTTNIAGGGTNTIFVAKLKPDGSAPIYSTYYGGGSEADGHSIAIDSDGNAYVIGHTSATNFPTSTGAFQTARTGGEEAVIVKLNPTATGVIFSTYFGGSSNEFGNFIAVNDTTRNITFTGQTASTNLPITSGAANTTKIGGTDAFVAEMNPAGSALIYSTYYGGTGDDFGVGLALDPSGDAYVAGYTASSNFRVTSDAFQKTYGGGAFDPFLLRLNPSGSSPVYSTYFGGSAEDDAFGIALDLSGNAYVVGSTFSNNFPNTTGAANRSFIGSSGNSDAFIFKFFMNPPISNFTANTTFGYEPQGIQFNDTSTSFGITKWNWSFGDNTPWFNTTDSTVRNATHTYNSVGSFTVNLTITNATTSDTKSQANYINVSAPLPIPAFTTNSTFGYVAQDIWFNDTTLTTNVLSWNWSFGDNTWFNTTDITTRNATHIYSLANSYTVNLNITNSSGLSYPLTNTNTTSIANFINISAPLPIPAFTTNSTFGYVAQDIWFNDTTLTTNVQSWNWSFGDNTWFNTTDITTRNATHIYSLANSYTVSLNITNSSGLSYPLTNTNTTSIANFINISTPLPIPSFTSNTTSGFVPLGVQFNDTTQSTNIQSWNWSFGDTFWFNTTSATARNATHAYSLTGSYTVNLSITNSSGLSTPSSNTNMTSRLNYISVVTPLPIPLFTGSPVNGISPLLVQFTDASTSPGITAWNWSFGDGNWFNTTNIAQQNASNTYQFGGSFTVNLSLTNSSGTNTTSRSSYITVNDLPNGIDFSGSPRSGNVPLFVQFTDLSITPGISAWNWSFGDGKWFNTTSAAQRDANNTYINAGSYRVNLSVTNTSGTNTTSKFGYITANLPPTLTQTSTSSGGGSSSGSTGPVVVPGLVQQVQPAATGAPPVSQEPPPDVPSPVNPPSYHIITTQIGILPEGLQSQPPSNGIQSFLLDRISAQNAGYVVDVVGNRVTASRPQSVLVINGANIQETPSGLITGSVQSVIVVVQPDPAPVDIGQVAVVAQASLVTLPENVDISVTVTDLVPDQTITAFELAAVQDGKTLTSVGYTVTFRKDGILATGPGIVRMTAPPRWVELNGGISAVRIARIGDNQQTEILTTSNTGIDADGNLIFEAPTPHGLSIFGLITVKCTSASFCGKGSQSNGLVSNETGITLPKSPEINSGIIPVISVIVILTAIVAVLMKRRRKYDPLLMS